MKVGELIGYLATCNQDYEVVIDEVSNVGGIEERRKVNYENADNEVIIWTY